MIVKIKSHKRASFGKLLHYMLDSKERLFDREKKSFLVQHNLKGNSIVEWEKQYKENEMLRLRRRTDSVILTHEILSWHRDDSKNISLAKLEEMTREYIRMRNPNAMVIATPHFDRKHYHVHLCVSGIEYQTGKSLRLSKIELRQLKNDFQQFQLDKFPELSNSIVKHGEHNKTGLTEKEYQIKLRTGRETEKERLRTKIVSCFMKASSK